MVIFEAIVLLFAMGISWRYMDRVIEEKKDRTVLYLFFVLITMFFGIAGRFYSAAYPEDLFASAIFKFCASLPAAILGLKGFLMEKNRFDGIILTALFIGLLADVSIVLKVQIGTALFGIVHILFDVAFISEKRPSKKQILIWIILTLVIDTGAYLIRDHFPSSFVLPGMIYLAVMVSTLAFSYPLGKPIFPAAVLFALSDIFLVVNAVVKSGVLFRTIALLIYYGGMLVYAVAIWEIDHSGK